MSELVRQFQKVQSDLGDQYLKIGGNFNRIMREMETSIAACLVIVRSFKQQADSEDSASLRRRIRSMEVLVDTETSNFLDLIGSSKTVLDRVTESFTSLQEIAGPVGEIQDAADLMSLLALNSMVVAIQAGGKGGGFTCITDELKQASASTYQTSVEIQRRAERVSVSHNEFINLSDRIRNFEETIREHLDQDLRREFSRFYELVTEFISFMENLEARSLEVKPAMMLLMQSLQNQDIIRQSMDHIILSLKELEERHDLDDNERAGQLLLKKQIFNLSHVVLQDIRRWLETDLENLDRSVRTTRELFRELNDSKTRFIARHRDVSPGAGGLSRQVVDFRELVGRILEKNEASGRLRREIWLENQQLLESVSDLESRSRDFEAITALFRNINVMARIEIARTDVFQNIENAVSEMEGINGRIEQAVSRIFLINHGVLERNRDNDQDFREIISRSQHLQSVFENDIEAVLRLLDESIRTLDTALCDFQLLSGEFLRIFNESQEGVEAIRKGYRQLMEMDGNITRQIGEIDQELSRLEHDGEVLEENRKKIEKILSQFTIYRHKQEAGKLAGVHMQDDGNAEESSVVLF